MVGEFSAEDVEILKEQAREDLLIGRGVRRLSLTGEPMRMKISDFTQKAICYDLGAPVRLDRRPWMTRILDSEHLLIEQEDGTLAPRRWTLMMTARQVEKSSQVSFKMWGLTTLQSNLTALYVSSGGANTKEFADERIANTLEISPVLRSVVGQLKVNNVFLKRLANNSRLVLRSVYQNSTAVARVRGIPADAAGVDEIQDIDPDHLPVIFACLKHSHVQYGPIRLCTGTPLTTDNIITQMWRKESTQGKWLTRCPRCRHWNPPGLEQIGKRGMICEKCGKALNPLGGQWVRMGRADAPYEGYHLSQVMMPYTCIDDPQLFDTKWKDLRKDVFSPTTAEGKMRNEILGEPWDVGRKPILEAEVRKLCRDDIAMSRQADYRVLVDPHWPVFMGVDWGTGGEDNAYTVVQLAYATGKDRDLRVFYAKRYEGAEADPAFIVSDLVDLIRVNNVELCIVDAGYGWGMITQLRDLVEGSMEKIIPMNYVGWASRILSRDMQNGHLVASKMRYMSRIFTIMKRGTWQLPRQSEYWDPFCTDILNIHAEASENLGRMKYGKVDTDDSFHALLYCATAKMLYYQELDDLLNA